MPDEVQFDGSCMIWTQVAQNRQHDTKAQRKATLPVSSDANSLYAAVAGFAEFVAESGGDIRTSVLAAIDDVQQIATTWMTKVDKGASETDINLAGEQLKKVIELYKALESYYVTEYEYARTGTGGD